jgi:hypothetical protein
MAGRNRNGSKVEDAVSIEISESELKLMSDSALVARLVARGVSRLTAVRVVEIQRGEAELGRARPHATARR